jgi:hypothetical protein
MMACQPTDPVTAEKDLRNRLSGRLDLDASLTRITKSPPELPCSSKPFTVLEAAVIPFGMAVRQSFNMTKMIDSRFFFNQKLIFVRRSPIN